MSELVDNCIAPPVELKLIPINQFHEVTGVFNVLAARGNEQHILLFTTSSEWKWRDRSAPCALSQALNENAGRILEGRGYSDCLQCERCQQTIHIHAAKQYKSPD